MNVTWNWAAAAADVERMRKIDPRFELLPRALADLALTFGETNRAIELYQAYLKRSPLDANSLDSLATALCAAQRLQQCLETRLRLQQLNPEYGGINYSVGLAHLYLGHFDAALTAMQRESDEHHKLAGLVMVYSAMGRRAESDAALNSLLEKFGSNGDYGIAEARAYRGEIDEAFRWLDRAYRDHDFEMVGVKADPLLRNLHDDQRFQALLSQMSLIMQSPQARVRM